MSHLLRKLSLLIVCGGALCASIHAQAPVGQPTLTAAQYVEEGNNYRRERQYDKAVDAYQQAIKLDPNLAAAYHALGSLYVNMGRAADALEAMKTAVRLDPNNALAHLNLSIVLQNLRRPDEALVEAQEAKRLSPNDARIHNELGNLLNNFLGRPDDALAAYLEARRLDPNEPAIQHNIGSTLMRLGRVAEAIAPLQEALRLDPRYRNARYLLSNAYSDLGRYEEAVESWGKFLELVPNGPEVLTKRSWNYMYAGGHGREAAADARKFLDVHGWRNNASPYEALIGHFGYREAGMDEEAQALLEEATKHMSAGAWPAPVIRYLKGETTADELMRLATDNDKKSEAHTYIGMNLHLKGADDEARTHFEWVKEYGNKRFYEYPLVVEELKRMGK